MPRMAKMMSDFCIVTEARFEAIHDTTILRYYDTYVDIYSI